MGRFFFSTIEQPHSILNRMTSHRSTIRWLIVFIVVSVVLMIINLPDFLDKPKTSLTQTNQEPSQQFPIYETTLPFRLSDNEYAGSTSCRECHTDEHKSWHKSYHRSMTQIMSPKSVKAAFNGQSLLFEGERFTMQKRGDEYWTTIENVEAANEAPDGRDPNPYHVRMGIVTGSHHMQVFWLPGMMGNLQIGFPFALSLIHI